MEALTPGHLILIIASFMLLFGYKKLPEAARSLGRSLRIFKSEMHQLRDEEPSTQAGTPSTQPLAQARDAPSAEELDAQAQAQELLAAQVRARAASHVTNPAAGHPANQAADRGTAR